VDGLVLEKEGKNPDGRDVAVKPIGDKEKKLDDRSNYFISLKIELLCVTFDKTTV
jgi:hypothetical protein